MTDPVAYSSFASPRQSADESQLKTLTILHYVWGGLAMFGSLLFIIHIILGLTMLRNPNALFPAGGTGAPPPPAFMGQIFIAMGVVMLTLGESVGVLSIIAGLSLAKRRRRPLIFVASALNCFCMPLGTALGIFTLIVLSRPSVREMFFVTPKTYGN